MSETQRPHISLLVPIVERFDDLKMLHQAFTAEVEKLGSYEVLYLVSFEFEDAFAQVLELHKDDPERVRVLRFARFVGEATALATG